MPATFAASFNGSNYLSVANYTGNPAAMSVSCWVNLATAQASRIFFSNYTGWAPGISDSTSNQVKFYLGAGTLGGAGTLTPGVWAFCVFTHDGTTARFYVNGVLNASLTSGLSYGGVPASNFIGSLNGSIQNLNGRLAAIGYWSKALTAGEVTALHGNGAGLDFSQLSGSLLTSLGSYHDFANSGNLGLDSTTNARNFANTGSVVQAAGPIAPGVQTSFRAKPARPRPSPRWSRGLARAQVFPAPGSNTFRDAASFATYPASGAVAWGYGPYGPCLAPNDATGQGGVNLGLPIAAGATEFTLSASAILDTTGAGDDGSLRLRNLWAAESSTTADMRLTISGGVLQFQVGADSAFANLVATPPPPNVPVVVICRLAPGGVRSIWYGRAKVAERTDAAAAWGSTGSTGLTLGGSSTSNRNWSGQVHGGFVWTIALSDAEIVALAADPFAPVRVLASRVSILSSASSGAAPMPYPASLLACM